MSLTQLIVAALAVWEICEIFHHGSIFAGWRAIIETWEGFFGQLLRCLFCLSVWVAALVTAILLLGPWWLQLPVYVFAVARLANLGNDLTYSYCRSPKSSLPSPPNGGVLPGGPEDPTDIP